MSILADSINFPLVALFGIAVFAPLTLLVTAVESLVLRGCIGIPCRCLFRPVLAANVASSAAGGVVYFFQDLLVYGSGIHDSIPAFVRGYRWLACLLIVLYLCVSVLVETVWLARSRHIRPSRVPRPQLRRAVALANVSSYLLVGPLFYFSTRPHFGGAETTFDAFWSANGDGVAYFLDERTGHIRRARLDGRDARTLVPHPADSFVVSSDESLVAYIDAGRLFVHRAGNDHDRLVCDAYCDYFITGVSLSPENHRVAYLFSLAENRLFGPRNDDDLIRIFDIDSQATRDLGHVPAAHWDAPLAWSADGLHVYVAIQSNDVTSIYVLDSNGPPSQTAHVATPPAPSQLVENYLRVEGLPTLHGKNAQVLLDRVATHAAYQLEIWPYIGSSLVILRNGERLLTLRNEYGLLKLGFPAIQGALFLPRSNELLLEWWNQLYVLDFERRKLGLAARGHDVVLRTPACRAHFPTQKRE